LKISQFIGEATEYDKKETLEFQIYDYCFMSNHVHLIINKQKMGDISLIMQRISTKYAGRFNRKYDRIGILIANRFKSEPVETEEYFLTLLRYIHQNPVNAGITKSTSNY
jgi:REP element-mobilizing transposase RayT